MKKINISVFLLVIFAAATTEASTGPNPQTVSNDGSIEIFNQTTDEGFLLPGYTVNDGSWMQLPIPISTFGGVAAIAGDGTIISGYIYARGEYFTAYSKAVVWNQVALINNEPIYSYVELPLVIDSIYSSADNMSENGKYIIGSSAHTITGFPSGCYWVDGDVFSFGTMIYDSYLYDVVLPYSVSNEGIIVGSASSSEHIAPQIAFMWDKTHGMRCLKDVLESDHGYDFSGCILSQAYNISSDGCIIDGYGYNDQGEYFDWVVTIPEPATMLFLAFGGLFLRKR